MSSILSKKIAKGDVGAYKELYNASKSKVFYINYLLLCDEAAAYESTKATFKSAFAELSQNPEKADGFFDFIEKKTVTYCKIKLAKNNSKEFSIPASKNFMGFECNEKTLNANARAELAVLFGMPALHRFIFVCGAYLKWTNEEIAQIIHTDAKTVALARDAEEANVAKISRALYSAGMSGAVENIFGLLSLLEFFQKRVEDNTDVDEGIDRIIRDVVAPEVAKRKKENKKKLLISVVVSAVVLFVALLTCAIIFKPVKDPMAVTHHATIEIENYGTIKLELYGNTAPETVENFETLANDGFYDGLTFHRIIEDFMMQGGCPEGNGTGGNKDKNGNEITIKGEFAANGHENNISHKRGVISMARNSYSKNSGSSQFFIVQKDTPHLDGQYAAFGCVIQGIEIVDAICKNAEPTDDDGTIPADKQPKIKSIRVEAA